MAGAAGAVIQAALASKLGHVRQATASYIHDRAEQGRSTLNAYLIAIGFYAVAGVFMIAALLVGAAALFAWVEDRYGLPTAFVATMAALVLLTAISALIAASAMRPPKKSFPSLGSRLRVAVHAPGQKSATAPRPRDAIGSARSSATSVLRHSPSPRASLPAALSPTIQGAGIATAVGLIGWALARRYTQASRPRAPSQ